MNRLTHEDTRELRHFGLGLALILVGVFWLLLPWAGDRPRPLWPIVAGAAIAVVSLTWPQAILPLHRMLRPVARTVGVINTWLLLGFVFFGILTPLGWVLRALGRLQYRTGFERDAATYRVEVPPEHVVRLEEPF